MGRFRVGSGYSMNFGVKCMSVHQGSDLSPLLLFVIVLETFNTQSLDVAVYMRMTESVTMVGSTGKTKICTVMERKGLRVNMGKITASNPNLDLQKKSG